MTLYLYEDTAAFAAQKRSRVGYLVQEKFEAEVFWNHWHKLLRCLQHPAQVVIVAQQPNTLGELSERLAHEGLIAFTKSVAKELGTFRSTCNLILTESAPGSQEHWQPTAEYLTSRATRFVTGQVIHVAASSQQTIEAPHHPHYLVTGGSGGIGQAIVHHLVKSGAQVTIVDHPQALARCRREFRRQHMWGADLATGTFDPALFAHLRQEPLHGVIHNAGITRDKSLFHMSRESWLQVLQVNLEGIRQLDAALEAQQCCHSALHTIYVSSITALAGNRGQTNYTFSKRALIAYAQYQDEKRRATQGRAFVIAPGYIETPMTQKMPWLQRMIARKMAALGRAGTPQDVAQTLPFLLSPKSHTWQSQLLRVCGGNFLGA